MAVKNIKKNTKKKKVQRNTQPIGKVYIYSGYNNTIVTITDLDGNTLCWGSSGSNGFKGAKKSTPYAATTVGEKTAKSAYEMGVREVTAFIKGVGNAKSHCVKSLRNGGLVINKIVDITPMPHNGCRMKKRKRS